MTTVAVERVEPIAEPAAELDVSINMVEEAMKEFKCQACFEMFQLNEGMTEICSDTCPAIMCTTCMSSYLTVCAESAPRGILSRLNCPICIRPVNMHRLQRKSSGIFDALDLFRTRVEGACEMLCPECHESCNLLEESPTYSNALEGLTNGPDTWPNEVRNEAMDDLPTVYELCQRYLTNDMTVDTFFGELVKTAFVGPFVGKVSRLLMSYIYDAERRVSLFLALMKHDPFEHTPCCSRPVCFTCKRDGHHHGEQCQAYLPSVEDMAQCSSCDLVLVKGDGCSSITCFCGNQFEWEPAVQAYRLKILTTEALTTKRSVWQRVLFYLRGQACRRRLTLMVISQIPSFVLQQRLNNMSPALFYPPWSTSFRIDLNKCMDRRRIAKQTAANRLLFLDLVVSQISTVVNQWRLQRINMAMAAETPWKCSLKALINAKVTRRRHAKITAENRQLFSDLVVAQIPVAVELRKLQQITMAMATSTAWKKSLKALVATYWSRRRYSSMIPLVAVAQAKRVEAKTRASFQLVHADIASAVAAKRWAKLEPQRMIVLERTLCRWVSVRRIRIAEVHARRRQLMKIVATIPGLIQLRQQELLKRQEETALAVEEIHDQIPMAIDMQHTQRLSRASNAFHHAIVSKAAAISARYRELVEPIDLPPQSISLERMPSSNEPPERNRMPVAA
ncbi:hypothetical protein Ae201684P_001640 [Aphanomyces euteiches]|uniref:RING-type domain-containing protein n=1 Tax=Aphanomyces euteiches TaxID=100861 RepID=A0A6G0X9C0_9STRA|nr:hypothetical protein Ae201684_007110 [Aphanomyces euteiches]KAH9052460.1 hypothetical protein Ae201684P_001640 [Aphanomyces euteiches]KAH9139525.1 hypothetical protein AeRB84_016191 [Aphanomyces euteiches]